MPPPTVRLDPATLAPPAELERPLVLIQPYSAATEKQSPAALYARLIEALLADWDVRLTGLPADLYSDPDIANLQEVRNVTYNVSTFEKLVPLLRAARLVVSPDTALMHLAVVVGAPTPMFRRAALNVIKAYTSKGSNRSKFKRAGWDNAFLRKLITKI